MDDYYRETWAEIRLDAIEKNMRSIRHFLPEATEIMAVVKADGYGHGAFETAETALAAGARMLAVAFLDEGIALRKKGIEAPILVLGYCPPEYAHIAETYRISLTVYQKEWLQKAESNIKQSLSLHLKCDTGMGRIGITSEDELRHILRQIRESDRFSLDGVFTHFAKADSKETDYYFEQLRTFKSFLEMMDPKPAWIHASNSAASLLHREGLFNMARIGIAMYGLPPSEEVKEILPFPLAEAFSLHTRISHVKKVEKGSAISYGCTYAAEDDEWIGTIPIGYADGWLRALQGQTVLVEGIRVPIVGRICMDQCMIRLPKYVPVGTKVTLIGKQGNEWIHTDEIAKKLQTINYEVVTLISARVPRVYKKNGETIKVINKVL